MVKPVHVFTPAAAALFLKRIWGQLFHPYSMFEGISNCGTTGLDDSYNFSAPFPWQQSQEHWSIPCDWGPLTPFACAKWTVP